MNDHVIKTADLKQVADHAYWAISGPEQGVQTKQQMFEHVRWLRDWFAQHGVVLPRIPYE